MTATATRTAQFAIRTRDAAWIGRNQATARDDGWVLFDVPVTGLTFRKFRGHDHIRHTLRDVPKDYASKFVACPAIFIPETARLLGADPEPTARMLAARAEVEAWKAEAGA